MKRDEKCPRSRPFGFADGVILLSAGACLAAMLRYEYTVSALGFVLVGGPWFSFSTWALPCWTVGHYWIPRVLAWLTLAWLLIRLWPPRPPLRIVLRQPGWAACSSGGLLVALGLLAGWLQSIQTRHLVVWRPGLWYDPLTLAVGAAVLGAWMHGCCAGRWRAEAHWIDRLGRAIGVAWIAEFAGVAVLEVATACWPWLLWHSTRTPFIGTPH